MPSVTSVLGATILGGALMAPLFTTSLLAGERGPSPMDVDRLDMAARASSRPKECRESGPNSRRRSMTIWDRARQPHLKRYCDLLGRAHTKLDEKPGAAREAARLADQVLPGKAAPWVLVGRAHVRLREFKQAVLDFDKARKLDPRSIEDPPSLHDLAIAQRKTGQLAEALTTYRALVPRLDLLPSTDARIEVLLETAALALDRGPTGLQEAVALLSEARAQPLSSYNPVVLGMLALTFDRAGMGQESRAVLDSIHRGQLTRQLLNRDPSSLRFLNQPAEWNAVLGLVLEQSDQQQAVASWQRYIDTNPAPVFIQHAKSRLDALEKTPRRYR